MKKHILYRKVGNKCGDFVHLASFNRFPLINTSNNAQLLHLMTILSCCFHIVSTKLTFWLTLLQVELFCSCRNVKVPLILA